MPLLAHAQSQLDAPPSDGSPPQSIPRHRSGGLSSFIAECTGVLGDGGVDVRPGSLERHAQNVSGYVREIPAVVFPSCHDDVVAVVQAANRCQVPLYPISCGKNWGFGSRLPVRDGCVIVDLSRMNRISTLDDRYGYAVIEPGVTQSQLVAALDQAGSRFFLDLTGAGGGTSILGNALERGIAYNTLRCETVSAMEVVLGSGDTIRTGFGHFPQALTTHLYKYGVGPSLDGLMMQSNFGIVTSGTVRLLPRPESECLFQVACTEANLGPLVDALRELLTRGVLDCIVHIGNRQRAVESMTPGLSRLLAERGRGPDALRKLLERTPFNDWTAIGVLRGTKGRVREARRLLKRAVGAIGTLRMGTEGGLRLASRIAGVLGMWRTEALLDASMPFISLARGVVTDGAVEGVSWGYGGRGDDPDAGRAGFLFSVPLAPMEAGAARMLVEIATDVAAEHAFVPAITLNAIDRCALEAVISIRFDRQDDVEKARAQDCIDVMTRRFIQSGAIPYRVNVDQMSLVATAGDPFWQAVRSIKDALDPAGIIAPGRYSLT